MKIFEASVISVPFLGLQFFSGKQLATLCAMEHGKKFSKWKNVHVLLYIALFLHNSLNLYPLIPSTELIWKLCCYWACVTLSSILKNSQVKIWESFLARFPAEIRMEFNYTMLYFCNCIFYFHIIHW